MRAQGLRALHGGQAVAVLETRETLHVDVALFLEPAGPRAPEALTVSVTGARRLIREDLLRAISETAIVPVLRVEPLAPALA